MMKTMVLVLVLVLVVGCDLRSGARVCRRSLGTDLLGAGPGV